MRAAALPGEDAIGAWHQWQATAAHLPDLGSPEGRLLPTAYANLLSAGLTHDALLMLRPFYTQAWAHNRELLTALREILATFADQGIDVMVLKGFALAPQCYDGDWGSRWMTDVDLYIRHAEATRAIESLQRAGWASTHTPRQLGAIRRVQHGGAFSKPHSGEIDLHWHLTQTCCWPGSDTAFWDAAVEWSSGDLHARTLCPTDHLFHVCVHAEAARLYNRTSSLYWAVDAAKLLRRYADEIDWTRIVTLAQDRDVTTMLHRRLVNLGQIIGPLGSTGASVPEATLAALARIKPSSTERLEAVASRRQNRHIGRAWSLAAHFLRVRRQPYYRTLLGPVRFLRDYRDWR